jgi:serine/threonine protein kinase
LGEGNSGIVYLGRIHSLPDPIAVKTLKVEASIIDLKNLLSEIKIMSYVGRHDNIVQLLGAHTAKIERGMSELS